MHDLFVSSGVSKVNVTLDIASQRDLSEGRKTPPMCLTEMKEEPTVKEVVCTTSTEEVTWNETFEL